MSEGFEQVGSLDVLNPAHAGWRLLFLFGNRTGKAGFVQCADGCFVTDRITRQFDGALISVDVDQADTGDALQRFLRTRHTGSATQMQTDQCE